ncbi:MAG TPA: tetratricopeptide repeat-containing glycosyltransferase family protein [Bradyrhizobium sp.]|jgi:tetratricopeptide (TPR) repeat protein
MEGRLDVNAFAADEVVAVRAAVADELRAGRLLEAQSLCLRALERGADTPEFLHLMALVSLAAGQFDHAVEWASRAIWKVPDPTYLTTLGTGLRGQGRRDEALQVFDKAVQLKPDDAELWSILGNALVEAGRLPDALLCFRHTLSLDPRRGDAAFKAGHILHGMEQFEEALVLLNRSAELQPDHVPTLQARAVVLKGLNRIEDAIADNRQAIGLDPGNADLCVNLGNTLQALERHEEALSWYDRALQIRPDGASATNRAMSLTALARFGEAMAAYRQSLALDPNQPRAVWNLSLLQLLIGDFEAGWRGREARRNIPELMAGYPITDRPMWLGEEPIAGKTIVVCQTEGLGDGIHFVRYVPMLAERGARVILVVDAQLHPLLRRLTGVSECLMKSPQTVVPPFDFHVAIDSLPLAFGTRLDSIPAAKSYLPPPDAERIKAWEGRLGRRTRLRVGLVWSGNPHFGNDRNRSMPLRTLFPLLDVDADFVSLQKNPRGEDAEALRERPEIVDYTADLSDFAETAALVWCLDLVISVDTSVVHLAAAMGRPVWLLVPFVPDWRWLLGRNDSPWYPTLRIFRQGETREYRSVIERVRVELAALVKAASKSVASDGGESA